MTTPNYFPTQYQGNDNDYLKVKEDKSGAARIYSGTVTVPATAVDGDFIGLIPFVKGARFAINSSSIYCGNWGGGSTTASVGWVYDDNTTYTNDPNAWATLSAAPQSGGYITVDEPQGLSFVAEANGWIVVEIEAANADAEAAVTFNILGSYDGLGVNNSNNQS